MEHKQTIVLPNIEKELNRLWEAQPNATRTKACLFNLIIYTHEPRRTAYFRDIVRMIIEFFPCRVLFILVDRSSNESFLKVNISSEVSLHYTGMACDYISIESTEDCLERVPFIILPHFVPDLPIYLLWGQDPTTETTILPYLQTIADRLIFDSECSENLQHFSKTMLSQIQSNSIDIIDMNWARMGGWRDVLAQTFDNKERIQQLASSKLIKIIYNNRTSDLFIHPEAQAIYLQAWLATQLQWEFEKIQYEHQLITLYFKTSQHTVEIQLQGKCINDLPSEEIIEFEASDQSSFLYSLTRKGDRQVIVHCNTMDRCELPFTLLLPSIRSGRSFIQEILYQKMSEHYFAMLHLISSIPWRSHESF